MCQVCYIVVMSTVRCNINCTLYVAIYGIRCYVDCDEGLPLFESVVVLAWPEMDTGFGFGFAFVTGSLKSLRGTVVRV